MREYLIYHMFALAAAIILDAVIGDPHRMPHPIRAIGALISALEEKMYPKDGGNPGYSGYFVRGGVLWIIVTATVAVITSAVT